MTMNVPTSAPIQLNAKNAEVASPQKQWSTSTPSPTEATSDDSSSSSSSSSDDDYPRKPVESSTTTAGLFIGAHKPLPLNSHRTVPLPIHRLWKKHGEVAKVDKAAPDILRKTGSTTAHFNSTDNDADEDNKNDQSSTGRPPKPRRTQSMDDSAMLAQKDQAPTRRQDRPLARSKSADYDECDDHDVSEHFFCEGQPPPGRRGRRTAAAAPSKKEIETDDYVNFSSMNNNSSLRGPFAFLRGKR